MLDWLQPLEEHQEFVRLRNWVGSLRETGAPISPQKRRPESIKDLGGVNELDERLYEVFDIYADWFNMIYEDSLFRIEERASAVLNIGGGFDGPTYGPSFNLFYADKKFGEIGVSRDLLSDSDDAASLNCEIWNAVFLGFNEVHGISHTLHSTIAQREEIEMRSSIDRAMQACIWNQIAFPNLPSSVHLSVQGRYTVVSTVKSQMRSVE